MTASFAPWLRKKYIVTPTLEETVFDDWKQTEGLANLAAQQHEALEALGVIINESVGIVGWHLNGAVAEWNEFPFVEEAEAALQAANELMEKYRD